MTQAAAQLSIPFARAALARGEELHLRVRGGSMRPLLRDGAIVRLERPRAWQPRAGDVVAVATALGLVIHRVQRVEGSTLVTRGDATLGEDRPVAREHVLARVSHLRGPGGLWLPVAASRTVGRAAHKLTRLSRLGRRVARRRG
jgi:hypothetical protein